MSEPEQPDIAVTASVPIVWTGGEQLDVIKVNQYLSQVDHAGDVFLTFGTMTPPVILAETAEEFQAQAEAIGYVPVRTVARLSLSPTSLGELVEVLQRTLSTTQAREQRGQEGSS